jgi:hypothetical protein
MRRNPRRHPRELLHDSAIFELLMDIGWFSQEREFGEACAAASRAPAWNCDREVSQLGLDAIDVATAPRQLAVKAFVVVPKRFDLARIETVDLILGQRKLEHDTSLPRQRTKA